MKLLEHSSLGTRNPYIDVKFFTFCGTNFYFLLGDERFAA